MPRWLILLLAWFRRDDAGARGEALATRFLQQERGYEILAHNWRNPRDRREELDLICRDGAVLVFVEVKARSDGSLVPGYHAVNGRKKRVLLRACSAYLRQLRPPPTTYRLDVVEVALPREDGSGAPVVNHFENIPLFPKHHRPGR